MRFVLEEGTWYLLSTYNATFTEQPNFRYQAHVDYEETSGNTIDASSPLQTRSGSLSNGIEMSASGNAAGYNATRSLYFDGLNDRIDITPALNVSSNLTVCAWVNIDGSLLDYGPLEASDNTISTICDIKLDGNHRFVFHIRYGTGQSKWFLGGRTSNSEEFNNNDSSHEILPGEWTHVAMTQSDDRVSLYRNGALVSNYTGLTHGTWTTTTFVLGITDFGDNDRPFHGEMDEVRVYTRHLDQGEIQQIYNGSR